MIPVEQLTSSQLRGGCNGAALQFHPFSPSTARSPTLCFVSGNLRCSSRISAQQQISCRGCSTVGFRYPTLSSSNVKPRRPGRGWKGATYLRQSFGSSFSRLSDGASMHPVLATRAGGDSFDDYVLLSDSPESSEKSEEKDSRGISSDSEHQDGKAPAVEGKKSVEEVGDGRLQRTTTVLEDSEDNGAGKVVQEEYSLTEDGTLRTVSVIRGEKTHRTNTEMDRVLAEVGIQAETLQSKIKNFSVRRFIKEWGKKDPELEDMKFNAAMYEPKEGVSNITQWTATELTLQRGQLMRISKDALYLVWAFGMFGCVRILEAVLAVFATYPPNYWKLTECMNAMDPLTVASLAHALRKPIVGMLEVDPTNLQEVSSLKSRFWSELHKFYERQWKVIATLGVAKLFTIIVIHLPRAEWVTTKAKVVWDITMALPIF